LLAVTAAKNIASILRLKLMPKFGLEAKVMANQIWPHNIVLGLSIQAMSSQNIDFEAW